MLLFMGTRIPIRSLLPSQETVSASQKAENVFQNDDDLQIIQPTTFELIEIELLELFDDDINDAIFKMISFTVLCALVLLVYKDGLRLLFILFRNKGVRHNFISSKQSYLQVYRV